MGVAAAGVVYLVLAATILDANTAKNDSTAEAINAPKCVNSALVNCFGDFACPGRARVPSRKRFDLKTRLNDAGSRAN